MNGTQHDHGCRPEPHCICGDNAWYHEDEEPGRCRMQGCQCPAYRRCRRCREVTS
jgi:hypothetical protein